MEEIELVWGLSDKLGVIKCEIEQSGAFKVSYKEFDCSDSNDSFLTPYTGSVLGCYSFSFMHESQGLNEVFQDIVEKYRGSTYDKVDRSISINRDDSFIRLEAALQDGYPKSTLRFKGDTPVDVYVYRYTIKEMDETSHIHSRLQHNAALENWSRKTVERDW
jgi:hypothetical protein